MKTKITKLTDKPDKLGLITSLDIETVNINDNQIPIAISAAYINNNQIKSIFYLANKRIKDVNKMVDDLWDRFFKRFSDIGINSVCFIHNLGSFDGFFLYKALINYYGGENVTPLISKSNEFIQILVEIDKKQKICITFKDSQRIFNVSLKKLGVLWESDFSKDNPYDVDKFNTISILDRPEDLKVFKEYSILDSVLLLDCMVKARSHYFDEFGVDIASIWSSSSLSMKIFRKKFLNVSIPTFNKGVDYFIRQAYFGGSNDHYLVRGENLYYYDVNSLYPKAMCNPIPLNLLKIHYSFNKNFNIEDFFGFIKCVIICPKKIETPILPYRDLSKGVHAIVTHPTGVWVGTYFSEELKAVKKYGYIVKPLIGYEFSKEYLFNNFVEHFYHIKSSSTGPKRHSAKALLNHLYGYFGRKLEYLTAKNVAKKDVDKYLVTRNVYSCIDVNDEITTVLFDSENLNYKIIKDLGIKFEKPFEKTPKFKVIHSNIAIAAAVTAYARIYMHQFKTIPDNPCYYTDTDSVFLSKPLDSKFISDRLGDMKDELDGCVIKQAIFLGNKKYCYTYKDKDGVLQTKTVFSGVGRDTLSLDDFEKMLTGGVVSVETKPQFIKTLFNLNVQIKSRTIRLTKSDRKKILNNKYIPDNLIYIPGMFKKTNLVVIQLKLETTARKLLKLFKINDLIKPSIDSLKKFFSKS